MELEPSSTPFSPVDDARPKIWPALPVMLVAVADVTLGAAAGLEKLLDDFYSRLLGFEREENTAEHGRVLVYRAENFRLRIVIHEVPPPRQDFKPLTVVVPSLADLAIRAEQAGVAFTKQRGLFAGSESLVMTDPAGNYLEATESRRVF